MVFMKLKRFDRAFLGLFLGALLLFSAPGFSQDEPALGAAGTAVSDVISPEDAKDAYLDPNLLMGIQEAYQRNVRLKDPQVKPQELGTLFFTLWQHRLLQEAKRLSYTNRNAAPSEMTKDAAPEDRPRGIRELSLGGILYSATDSWIVWLNGQRVTPTAIPKQVIDIQVKKDFIELKWYDAFTNLIFPIRLQPHQRFNLDSRIFLPGSESSL